MAGLLYKDFIAVRGRMCVKAILLWISLIFILRVAIPGEEVDYVLMGLVMYMMFILYGLVIFKLEVHVVSVDEGRKQKQYFLSFPVSKRQYVASKYIFLLLTFFVILSAALFSGSICLIRCQSEEVRNMITGLQALTPIATCVMLWIPIIELPFFIGLGGKTGSRIKTGLLILLFFISIIYLLFGDLAVFAQINLAEIIHYFDKHQGVFLMLEVLVPYISLGMYYVSYRISCLLFERKEWEDD